MIDTYLDALEAHIRSNLFVVSIEIERAYTSPTTGYAKVDLTLMDGSRLIVFEHVRVESECLRRTDYRYHYMDAANRLIFRYDNARHHPEIDNFSDHRHTPSGVEPTHPLQLKEIKREVDVYVIRSILGD